MTDTNYLVIYLRDCGGLYSREFDSEEDAREFLEFENGKAYLITGSDINYEDRT